MKARKIALTFLIVGNLGLMLAQLAAIEGWPVTVLGAITVCGLSGWLATWRRRRR